MARDLTGATAILDCVSAVTTMPCTVVMWFKPTVTSTGTIAGLSDGTNNNRCYIQRATAADPAAARAVEVAAGSSAGVSTGDSPVANNAWGHWAATYGASNARSIFFNGVDKTSNTSGLGAQGALNHLWIGATGAGVASAARGHFAEIAIWDVVLSDSDIALLGSNKYSPGLVNAAHLKGYWKLLGTTDPEPNEVSGGVALTLTGAPPQSAHPPGIVYTLAPIGNTYLWSKGALEAYVTSAVKPHFHQGAATTPGDWETPTALTIPVIMPTAYRWDSTGTVAHPGPYVTVNWTGEIFTSGINTAPVGAITSDAGSDLYIGNKPTLDGAWSGYISEFIVWNKTLLTSPQLNLLYMEEQIYYGSP